MHIVRAAKGEEKMRLIDGDALLRNIRRAVYPSDLNTTIAVGICESHVKDMPTIDAVPVVRCKDCRFGAYTQMQGDYMITCQNAESPVCGTDKLVKPDWFCACGEPERRCES